MEERLAELERRRARPRSAMGGPERIERHHASGRLTARERLDALVDPGSFYEIGLLADAQHRRERAGAGRRDRRRPRARRRPQGLRARRSTRRCSRARRGRSTCSSRTASPRWAGERGLPLICISDNDGGRIPDVMGWRFSGLPFDFRTFVQAPEGLPEVPRLIAVVGASFGDSALHASMGHFVVMTRKAAIALSGPPVVAAAIGEELTADELGGPKVSSEQSGNAHARRRGRAGGDRCDPARARLPAGLGRPPGAVGPCRTAGARRGAAPLARAERPAARLRHAQGARRDRGRRTASSPGRSATAAASSAAFARIEGEAVGLVASQPMQRAGVMDVPALTKVASFVDLCDTFNLPLVFLQDVPGLMIGSDAERGGILGGYERVVGRLARAKVPKVTVVVRKAYGGGHFALGGRPTRPDLVLAWPTAEMGFMAPGDGHPPRAPAAPRRGARDGGQGGTRRPRRGADRRLGARVRALGGGGAHLPRRRDRPPPHARGDCAGIDFAWGSTPRISSRR